MTEMSPAICMSCFEPAVTGGICGACRAQQDEPNRDRRAIPAGTVVADKYLIGKVLGSGGFGITYLAKDVHLSRRVALKEFLPSGLGVRDADKTTLSWNSANDQGPFQRGLKKFFQEGQILAKFNHPNIVRVHEVFRANGTAYLAMEYLEGLTLQSWLAQSGGRIEASRALDVATFIFDALHTVHAAGVVHRDLKPDNVYLTPQGRALLLDFGGAKQVAMESDKSVDFMLSNGYAAPEQYRAEGNKVGPWTDVYACGATLYKMMTGVTPRGAMDRYVEDPPLDWSKTVAVPAVRGAIERALALKHTDRYPTIREFQRALESEPLAKEGKGHGSLGPKVALGGVLVACGLGALAWYLNPPADSMPQRNAAVRPPAASASASAPAPAPAPVTVDVQRQPVAVASSPDVGAAVEPRPTPASAPVQRQRKPATHPATFPTPAPVAPSETPTRPPSERGETMPDQR